MDWRVAHDEQQQGLESILARRDSSTRLLTQLMEQAAQQKLQQQRLALDTDRYKEDRAVRVQGQQDMADYRKGMAEDRDAARGVAEEGRFQNRVKLLPKGSIIKKGERADFDKFGGAPLLKHHGPDEHAPEDHDEFVGTQSAAEAETKAAEAQRWHDMTEQIRQATEAGRISTAQARLELDRLKLEFEKSKPVKQPVVPDTPAQIREKAAARAAGTVQGRTSAQPKGFLAGLKDAVLGTSAPQATPVAPTSGAPAATPQIGQTRTYPNGRTATWDGHGWVAQ